MKNLILSVIVAVTGLFAIPGTAEAGLLKRNCCVNVCCEQQTTEVCRRYFCTQKCFLGRVRTIHWVEITYRTVDSCGRCHIWKKTYRCR